MTSHTHDTINVVPTENLNGTYNFYLKTGYILKRHNFTEYPMPQRVMNKVNRWGARSKETEYSADLYFRNHTKEKFEWDIEDDMGVLIYTDPG